jgi:tetratricopeptide (TPR) repeat protein
MAWQFSNIRMSSPVTKGLKRSSSRTTARRSTASSAKNRSVKAKSPRPKAKRAVAAKSTARKAPKSVAAARQKIIKKSAAKAKAVKSTVPKNRVPKKATLTKGPARKPAVARPKKLVVPKVKKVVVPRVKKTQKLAAVRAQRPTVVPPPRQPTLDESAALKAFERAHKEFTRGRFGEARNQFRALLDKYAKVSEVAARARTYLAIAESRLRTESMLPRDADSLYDRGVIELNRGEYVAAQEMFERALKREPEAAHIHYGLAATRARLGSIDLALESLQRALDLQPNLRVRAQHDQDLTSLRNDPDFDKLVFQPRV